MRYIIVSPAYDHDSAWIVALHELRKWLIRSGKEAMILDLAAPCRIENDDIVVYPEAVPGNPLHAKRVVRYLFNTPGKPGSSKEYDRNELLVAYYPGLAPSSNGVTLTIPITDDCFTHKGYERSIDCFWVGNGKNTQHPVTKNCLEITRQWAAQHVELSELLNRTKTFYSYDTETILLHEAACCGCDIRLLIDDKIVDCTLYQQSPDAFKTQLSTFIELTGTPEIDSTGESLKTIDKTESHHLTSLNSPITPKASIIIPLYNQAHLTRMCVEAIKASAPITSYELVLIDNGSHDWTPEYLASLGTSVTVITNRENRGFAVACNQGARAARGDILVFLNNDTVPEQGWLDELVAAIDNGEAEICGARLLYPDGRCQHAGVAFDERGLGYHIFAGFQGDSAPVRERRLMQAVTAACMAMRKGLFHELGGFDEGFRNGFEDIDLCLRAGQRGHRILFVPESVVIHHAEQSSGRKDNELHNLKHFFSRWLNRIRQDDIPLYARFGFESRREPDGSLSIVPAEKPNQDHRC
ncbi:glycosyltransferase family 2 protein [Pelobacter propionicus]|uniref:Glycosyl transferase, family 2 n=1 Tax=Pelobacter propionicus (strain DSM 2379 / NBRC 103807 / OttBd1) TaxID=338966 RepID=A1ALI9_PELPD|nr:glycosyltransferase family 2 protein [Pelobacter propionicus]ABK98209.1 glycosyl transferase, family 2 [Pelobacter propionicus DSM 2379]